MNFADLPVDLSVSVSVGVAVILNWIDTRRVREEVVNRHSTNLRDDIDVVRDIVIETQLELHKFAIRLSRLEAGRPD